MKRISFQYLACAAEPATHDYPGAPAYCEAFEIAVNGRQLGIPEYVTEAAEKLAEAVERFREEEQC